MLTLTYYVLTPVQFHLPSTDDPKFLPNQKLTALDRHGIEFSCCDLGPIFSVSVGFVVFIYSYNAPHITNELPDA